MNPPGKRLLIGIGNDYRQDDAIGLLIARDIREKNIAGLEVRESTGDMAELVDLLKDADWALAVDALASGGVPGTIRRFEAQSKPLPTETFRHSTHSLSLPDAIEMARALGQLPKTLLVLGVEGKNFAAGRELSQEIQEQRKPLVHQILREISPTLGRKE